MIMKMMVDIIMMKDQGEQNRIEPHWGGTDIGPELALGIRARQVEVFFQPIPQLFAG